MKTKHLIAISLFILFSVPVAIAALEIPYDSGPYSNGVRLSKTLNYSARVRFTPTSEVIGQKLQQVKIYWCDKCTDKAGKFSILIYDCNDTYEGSKTWFNSTATNQLGVYQSIDVSALNFVVTQDFCVEVRAQEDTELFIFYGGDNSSIDRSYHYGYPNASWHSFVELQSYVSSLRELAIRAVVSTPIVTTTTLPPGPPGDGGGGGGGGDRRNRSTCYDGIRNCHHGSCESGIDCGGPCLPCPTCSDGIQNQGEEGIDCGGPCPPCPTTTTTTTMAPTTTLPPCPDGCQCLTEAEAKARFPSYEKCIEDVCGYESTPITAEVPMYCFREVTTTTTTIEPPPVTGRVVAFPTEATITIFILFLLLLFFFYWRRKKGGKGV